MENIIRQALSKEEAEFYNQLKEESLPEMVSGLFQGRMKWINIMMVVGMVIVFALKSMFSHFSRCASPLRAPVNRTKSKKSLIVSLGQSCTASNQGLIWWGLIMVCLRSTRNHAFVCDRILTGLSVNKGLLSRFSYRPAEKFNRDRRNRIALLAWAAPLFSPSILWRL